MPTRTKQTQFISMGLHPNGKSVVVLLRRYPAGTATSLNGAVFCYADLRVGAVDFFGDDAFSGKAGHLGEVLKVHISLVKKPAGCGLVVDELICLAMRSPIQETQGIAQLLPNALYRGPSGHWSAGLPRQGMAV